MRRLKRDKKILQKVREKVAKKKERKKNQDDEDDEVQLGRKKKRMAIKN